MLNKISYPHLFSRSHTHSYSDFYPSFLKEAVVANVSNFLAVMVENLFSPSEWILIAPELPSVVTVQSADAQFENWE